jgi:hypothetical protein
MAEIKIMPVEEFPVFKLVGLNESPRAPVEIPKDKLKWVNKVFDEYEEVQRYLENLFNGV